MQMEKDKRQQEFEMKQVMDSFEIARWIAEEFSDSIREEDRTRLQIWLSESKENAELYRELKQEVALGYSNRAYSDDEIEQQLRGLKAKWHKGNRMMCGWYWSVAVVVLLVGIVTFMRWQGQKRDVVQDAAPIALAKQDVRLVLASGESLVLTDTLLKMDEEEFAVRVPEREIVYSQDDSRHKQNQQHTLLVPRGAEFKVQLADGTRVWVNSCTEFRYPLQFTGEQREVYLKGEAYFEVASNKDKPFIVHAEGGVKVRVLGTSFNVSAYEYDHNVTTTLAEGRVELVLPEQTKKMVPGEQLIFEKEKGVVTIKQVDAMTYSAWKDGKFVFENQCLEQIMNRLKLWYEMEVVYANEEVKSYRFTGDLKKYDSFEQIIRMLEEVAGVKIVIQNGNVIIGTK